MNKAGTEAGIRAVSIPLGEIAAWAEDDFRSINGQIEYLLHEAVKQRRRSNKIGLLNRTDLRLLKPLGIFQSQGFVLES